LAPTIDMKRAEPPQRPPHDATLQEGTVIAEGEMIRTANGRYHAAVAGESVINGANGSHDLTTVAPAGVSMVAQQEHERAANGVTLNDTDWRAIDIDASAATCVLGAELRGFDAT
jgi:hypothetical protein